MSGDAVEVRNPVARWWRALGPPRVRRTLLVVLVLGGLVRVAWVAHAGVKPHFVSDPSAYLLQGKMIARGDGYTNPIVETANVQRAFSGKHGIIPEHPSSFYPPGYPTFAAGVA